MTKNILLLTVTLFCFACGSSSSESANSTDSSNGSIKKDTTPKENVVPINSTHIDIFGSCDTYDNRLSSVASEIKFVKLDDSQLFNNYLVNDIKFSDKYIFLLFMQSIKKYDRNGNFICNIGKKGRGPKEFLQLNPPLNIDYENELLYATDGKISKIFAYNFDGTLNKIIRPKKKLYHLDLITTKLFANRQDYFERQEPNIHLVEFYNLEGDIIKRYTSNIYPTPNKKRKLFQATSNIVWKYENRHYMLEFGSDTIFQFLNDSLIFSRTVGGKYRLKKDEHRDMIDPKSLEICNGMMRPNNGIFESDTFLIFTLVTKLKAYFKVYNKISGTFHQTKHKDYKLYGKEENHTFFTDDIVSGLKFKPDYQSFGKAIGFVSALELFEKKDEVLKFIKNNPSDESSKLKTMVDNLDPDGGDFLMIVKFK